MTGAGRRRPPRARRWRTLRWALPVAIIAVVLVYLNVTEAARSSQAELLLIALGIPAATAAHAMLSRRVPAERYLPALICTVFAILAAGRVLYLVIYAGTPYLIDIARTTLDAARALSAGQNPYQVPVDPNPEYPDFTGFKYLPVMIFTYWPLGMLFGASGMRLTNLVLDLAAAGLVAAIVSREGGWIRGLLAASLYLMLPMLGRNLYKTAVTDLAPTVPLLAAMALYRRRPGLAGLLVGLSISAKLLPGLIFVACCFPAAGRGRYALGCVLGLIPAVVFLVLGPADFIHNTVWFIATRPSDSTSWLNHAPHSTVVALRLLFIVTFTAVAIWVVLRPPDLFERCGLAIFCLIFALLTGPTTHNNYMLWWLPFFCIMLSAPLGRMLAVPSGAAAASDGRLLDPA